jgi:hypothetical protein
MTPSCIPGDAASFLLIMQSTLNQDLLLGASALVTVCGMWICWGTPRYRMLLEERVKDGRISAEQARWRINQSQWVGPVVTTLGVCWLAYVATR